MLVAQPFLSASPSATLPGVRNASVDVVRFAAAIIIILFHAKLPVGWLMPGAMGFFTATVAYYAAASREGVAQVLLARRVQRLLRPFLVWGAIYGGLRITDAVVAGNDVVADLGAWLPPSGTMGQLWFLPFAFVVSQGVCMVRRLSIQPLPHEGPRRAIIVMAGTLILSALWLWVLSRTEAPAGVRVYLNFVPSVFFGAAAGLLSADRNGLLLLGLAGLVLATVLMLRGIGETAQLWIGCTALIACLLTRGGGNRYTRLANALSLPVYLVHVLVIAVLLRVLAAPIGSAAFVGVTVGVSVILGLGLLQTRAGRALF